MSLFFVGERRMPVEPEPTPNWEPALQAIANRLTINQIAGAGNMSPARAEHLQFECRRIDPMVTLYIVDHMTAPQANIVQYIRDNTEGFFPAARFVDIMKTAAGGTLALLRSACTYEING